MEDWFEVAIVLSSRVLAGWLEGVDSTRDSPGWLRSLSWSLRAPRSFVSIWSFTWKTVHDVSTRVVSHWSVVTGGNSGFVSGMVMEVDKLNNAPNRHPRVISRNS